MLQQYRAIKARYPDAMVLFRLGDFYEMFEDDARVAARELELVLTTRSFSKDVRLAMCGVPHQHVVAYIARLIDRGYKVAVVEQLEDARKVRRLVRRDVVRVITPGTVVEDALLHETSDNYLVALNVEGFAPSLRSGQALRLSPKGSTFDVQRFGLAAVDLSTGEFAATQFDGPGAGACLFEELERLAPSEVVLPAGQAADETFTGRLLAIRPARISPLADAAFDPTTARQRLLDHLRVASLDACGCDDLPLATAAAGAALHYLQSSQISDLAHLNRLITYRLGDHMTLDGVTRRNLELTAALRDGSPRNTLFAVLNRTQTAMGARALKRWINQPLLDPAQIQARLDAVEELVGGAFLRDDLRGLLDGLYDVERLVGRVGFGNANARDLVALRRTLERLPDIRRRLAGAQSARLCRLHADLDELQDVAALIGRAIVDDPPIFLREGGLIRPGYDHDLDRLRQVAAEGEAWLADLEDRERERSGLKSLRVRYNEVFGYFIEVPRSQANRVPTDYERRATISHAERFVTPELKLREAEILGARDRAAELEYELFAGLRRQVAGHITRLQQAGRILAELDVLAALAETAARHGYVKPVVDDGDRIEIRDGRHPVVERTLPEGERFVANDVQLDADANRLLIITGPNMSGKSVYVRQVALIVLMAQMGSFVPAASARIGRADRIFVRAGASDDIAQGRSTFWVEMSETSHILHHASPRSLVILDEVGRGTSTYDGMSLAWAVAEYLHDVAGARALFATHYHELTRLAEPDHGLPGVRNYSMAVHEQGDEVIFLRRVVPGAAEKSFGIHVARLAGLPERVVRRAEEVLGEMEGREEGRRQEAEGRGQEAEGGRQEAGPSSEFLTLPETRPVYEPGVPVPMPPPWLDSEAVLSVFQEILRADIANMTPLQALVVLNELQQRLRGGR
jgi:DNA mismatch repair protein MutS